MFYTQSTGSTHSQYQSHSRCSAHRALGALTPGKLSGQEVLHAAAAQPGGVREIRSEKEKALLASTVHSSCGSTESYDLKRQEHLNQGAPVIGVQCGSTYEELTSH